MAMKSVKIPDPESMRPSPRGSGAWGKDLVLHVAEVKPNIWNPNRMDAATFEKEKASITRFGFVQPVIVRRLPSGEYELVDGEHRLKAAIELGMTEIPAFEIGPISEHEARQLTVLLNELHGQAEPERLADLLRGLLASDTLDNLVEVLPYSKEEFGKIAQLPEFDWDQFKQKTEEEGSGERWKEFVFRMPPDSARVLERALSIARDASDGNPKDWQALEMIAASYLGDQ